MSNSENNQINLLRIIQWLVISIRKNFVRLIILNLLILLAGISIHLYIPKKYEGRLIVKSTFIEFHFISEILAPLNRHKLDYQTESIAKTLNIPIDVANSFAGFQVNSLIDEEYVTKRRNYAEDVLDEYEKDQIFELIVFSAQPKNLPILKNALLNYLRKQDYIKNRQVFYLEKQKAIKNLIDLDINSMSMIKEGLAKEGFNPNVNGNDLLIQGLGDFYFGSIRIYENYLDNMYALEFNDSFEELSRFEIYKKHASPRWTPSLMITLLAGIIISFIFLLAIEVKNSLKELD